MVIVQGLPDSVNKENGIVAAMPPLTQNPNVPICDYRQPGRQQIMTITNENITQICTAEEPVNQDLMTIAETMFASPAIWNASFLLPNNKHVPSTWKNIGIDLHEVYIVLFILLMLKR
jgi:hypothetical protein